jgi:AcrR family transcriptional regulator
MFRPEVVADGPQPGLRERNRLERQARIKLAALAVFRERGYTGATTREIAARANVAIATLFAYAREKRDLLLMIFSDELVAINTHAFSTVPSDAPTHDQFIHIFQPRYELWGTDPDLSRHAVHEIYAPLLRDEKSVLERTESRLTEFVLAKQRDGSIDRRETAAVYARAIMDVYLNENHRWVGGRYLDIDTGVANLRKVLRVVLRGMSIADKPTKRAKKSSSNG